VAQELGAAQRHLDALHAVGVTLLAEDLHGEERLQRERLQASGFRLQVSDFGLRVPVKGRAGGTAPSGPEA
jgi:hypothetical protein